MKTRSLASLIAVPAAAAVAALALTGCSAGASGTTSDGGSRSSPPPTSTATSPSTIAGQASTVTTIIRRPQPGSALATRPAAQNQLALSKADIVIENGGGYDDFMDTMLSGADSDGHRAQRRRPLRQDSRGRRRASTSTSGTTRRPLHKVAEGDRGPAREGRQRPRRRRSTTNDNAFTAKLADPAEHARRPSSRSTTGAGRRDHRTRAAVHARGESAWSTRHPPPSAEAIEEGTDVSPAVLQQMLDLFGSGAGEAARLQRADDRPGDREGAVGREGGRCPVVRFTETLPDGKDYISWMTDNLNAIVGAR